MATHCLGIRPPGGNGGDDQLDHDDDFDDGDDVDHDEDVHHDDGFDADDGKMMPNYRNDFHTRVATPLQKVN